MSKAAKQYPEDTKTVLGMGFMGWMNTIASSLMTSLFMLYLTDYAGLKNGATIATVVLLVMRLFDAVDDPVQGWIMDNGKQTKIGKYKPFMILGTVVCGIGLIVMYNSHVFGLGAAGQVTLICIFYVIYIIGYSFYPFHAMVFSLTNDDRIRGKIYTVQRVITTLVAIPVGFVITLSEAVSGVDGGDKWSIGIFVVVFVAVGMVVTLIGTAMVKEGKSKVEQAEHISVKEMFSAIIQNKALLIYLASIFFYGFVYTFMSAAITYYIRWGLAYGSDGSFGTYTMIYGVITLISTLLGATLASKVFKNMSMLKAYAVCCIMQLAAFLALSVCHFVGIMNPVIFFVLIAVCLLATGLGYMPQNCLSLETIDYGLATTGRELSGITSSAATFVAKFQTAIASTLTGGVLMAVGYVVDEAGNLVSEVNMGQLLNGLMLVMAIIPAVCAVLALVIIRKTPMQGDIARQIRDGKKGVEA